MLLNLVLIILSVINPISNETLSDNSENLRSESDTEHAQLFSNIKFLLESKDERYLRNKELNPNRNIDHNIGNIDHHFGNIDHHLGNADHHLGNTEHNLSNIVQYLGNTDHFETQTLDISYLEESEYTLGKKLKEKR